MDLQTFLTDWHNDNPRLLVHTSGSTGQPKPLWVEKRRMEASARMTCAFLGLQPGDRALLCLPLDYIAGKMMVVRSEVGVLELTAVEPTGHPLAGLSPQEKPFALVAMVPLQVYNSLQVPEESALLRQIRHLIIGGGAVDDALADALRDFPNAVWSTYGMTETLSHIALRRLSGPDASDWYTPFPSVTVSLSDESTLIIDAPEVCAEPLTTNDIAVLSPPKFLRPCGSKPAELERGGVRGGLNTRFRILGRKDNIICSGGLKIQAEELERQLRPHLCAPYIITKRPDPKFGEIVVLLTEGSVSDARQICERILPKFHQPHAYLHVSQIPLTETGKPSRHEAEKLARL